MKEKIKIPGSPETLIKLKQLAFICLYWVVSVRIIIFQNFFGTTVFDDLTITTKFIDILRNSLVYATLAGLAIGLITGIGELFIFPKKFYQKRFFVLTVYKLLVYFISIFLVSIITLLIYKSISSDLGFSEIVHSIWDVMTSFGFISLALTGLLLSLGINLILTVQNKIGLTNFAPLLLGRYHKPRAEKRIFLFIDLKSSSFTAEKLGYESYSRLIQECFGELSQLISLYNGEIYQFVGDEAVITWKAKNTKNFDRSVILFDSFIKTLENKSHNFYYKYGVMPHFKGAINSGNVMVAEVGGFLKTEIAYHGDVLNTASRMMEHCNPLNSDLLISQSVYDKLEYTKDLYSFKLAKNIELRGKAETHNIYISGNSE